MSTCYFSLFTIARDKLLNRAENWDPSFRLWALHNLGPDASKLYLESLATFQKLYFGWVIYLVFSSYMASSKKDHFSILEQDHVSATG